MLEVKNPTPTGAQRISESLANAGRRNTAKMALIEQTTLGKMKTGHNGFDSAKAYPAKPLCQGLNLGALVKRKRTPDWF